MSTSIPLTARVTQITRSSLAHNRSGRDPPRTDECALDTADGAARHRPHTRYRAPPAATAANHRTRSARTTAWRSRQPAGFPSPLPHEPEFAERYLETVPGLIVTGRRLRRGTPPSSAPATRHEDRHHQGPAHRLRARHHPRARMRARGALHRHLQWPAADERGARSAPSFSTSLTRGAGRPRPRSAQPAHRAGTRRIARSRKRAAIRRRQRDHGALQRSLSGGRGRRQSASRPMRSRRTA